MAATRAISTSGADAFGLASLQRSLPARARWSLTFAACSIGCHGTSLSSSSFIWMANAGDRSREGCTAAGQGQIKLSL